MAQLSSDDRLAIQEVLAAYCHAIDKGRWDDFCALFTPDCQLDFGKLMGAHAGHDGVRNFTEILKSTGLFMRHYTLNVIVSGDGERARASSYVLAITGTPGNQSQTTGFYEDELLKTGGRWLLRVRRALIDLPEH